MRQFRGRGFSGIRFARCGLGGVWFAKLLQVDGQGAGPPMGGLFQLVHYRGSMGGTTMMEVCSSMHYGHISGA